MKLIHRFFALPGLSTEVMHVYAARELQWVGQRLEPDEEIDVVQLSFDQLLDATASGEVVGMAKPWLSLLCFYQEKQIS